MFVCVCVCGWTDGWQSNHPTKDESSAQEPWTERRKLNNEQEEVEAHICSDVHRVHRYFSFDSPLSICCWVKRRRSSAYVHITLLHTIHWDWVNRFASAFVRWSFFFHSLFVGRWDTNWLLQLFLSFRVPQEIRSWREKKKKKKRSKFNISFGLFTAELNAWNAKQSPNLWTGVVTLNLLFFLESKKRGLEQKKKNDEKNENNNKRNWSWT